MGINGVRRRTLQRQSRDTVVRGPLQTSASLPETPVFARGCDLPRSSPRAIAPTRTTTITSMQSIGENEHLYCSYYYIVAIS